MTNLALWKQVEKTNPAHTKKVEFGRKFTAIDAHSQIMAATEAFGPCGIGWGVSDSKYTLIVVDANDPHYNLISYTALLWFKHGGETGSLDISADIELFEYSNKQSKWNRVEDTHKKVKTDALTKGLSWLGFNADVFMGKFDDNKYVREVAQEFSEPRTQTRPAPLMSSITPVEPAQSQSYREAQAAELRKLRMAITAKAKEINLVGEDFKSWLLGTHKTTWEQMTTGKAELVLADLAAIA